MLLRQNGVWALPWFDSINRDARGVDHINGEMRRLLGLDTVTLRCAAYHKGADDADSWRTYFAVARDRDPQLPYGARWLEASDLPSLRFASEIERDAVAAWFARRDAPDTQRTAWESAGWFDTAAQWVHERLDALGMPAVGQVRQQRVWGLSCTMRVDTTGGVVYFKATPPFMAHEGKVMRAVAERCPSLLPPPLAVDERRGWLLMSDYGDDLLHRTPDIERWEDALRRFASVQVEQAAHTQDWLELGCPDRGLARMVGLIDPLIAASVRMLGGNANGLSDDEAKALQALSMPLKMMCARLAQYPVPHSLVHGDLGGNIIMRGDGYIFFDWTDVCISHPFFEMATISSAYFDEGALAPGTDSDVRLRDAFLEAWTAYAPMQSLVDAFETAKPLGALHQAMTYMWICSNIADLDRAEFASGLAHWIRQVLRLCGHGSLNSGD